MKTSHLDLVGFIGNYCYNGIHDKEVACSNLEDFTSLLGEFLKDNSDSPYNPNSYLTELYKGMKEDLLGIDTETVWEYCFYNLEKIELVATVIGEFVKSIDSHKNVFKLFYTVEI